MTTTIQRPVRYVQPEADPAVQRKMFLKVMSIMIGGIILIGIAYLKVVVYS